MKKNIYFFAVSSLVVFFELKALPARTVAFCYAIDTDLAALVEGLGLVHVSDTRAGNCTVQTFVGDGREIHAVKMGSGPAQTAFSTGTMLALKRSEVLFSVGPVGGISDVVKQGDWAVVGTVVPFQRAMILEQYDPLTIGVKDIAEPDVIRVPLPDAVAKLKRISVASGEAFLASDSIRSELHETTGCDAIDMNLLGLTIVTAAHAVPSLHLRVISDHADDDAGETFVKFVNAYKGEGGRMIAAVIREMPADVTAPSNYPNLKELLNLDGTSGEGEVPEAD